MRCEIIAFFDPATSTVSYLVIDRATTRAAAIDPVLDYDARSGRTSTASAERLLAVVNERDLMLEWVLETHAHADHLTAAAWLHQQTGARIGIGYGITTVQETFRALYNIPVAEADGRHFNDLFRDGAYVPIGNLTAHVLHTPGHTPACISYRIEDAVFVGDTLFMPDYGTARCDFPGGDAATLYRSIRRLLDLPPETRIFVGHDYAPGGRAPAWETTVAAQRASNIHVRDGISEEEFVAMRTSRDATLELPALLLPALQVNIRAGALPPAEDNGTSYLKIPLNAV